MLSGRHTSCGRDWSSDVCSSDLDDIKGGLASPGYFSAGSGTLTIGPGITVTGTNGIIEDSDASLVNQGTIHFDVRGGQIRIGGVREVGRASCRERGAVAAYAEWTAY